MYCPDGRIDDNYDERFFTAASVVSRARWQTASIFHGGCFREIRYKEVPKVYWQGRASGIKRNRLREIPLWNQG